MKRWNRKERRQEKQELRNQTSFQIFILTINKCLKLDKFFDIPETVISTVK